MTPGIRLIILILLAAAPIFIVQVLHDFDVRESRISEITRRAETLAGLVTARQDRVVEGARLLLTATSHLQSIREKNPEECHRRLKEIASHTSELTAIAVLAPDGERWCASLEGGGYINLHDRKYFQETLRTGTMQTSNYIIGRQTGEGSLVFTYPSKDETGAIRAVVFVAYRTSVLSRLLNEPPLPEGAAVAILDRDGTVAARWPEPEKWMGQDLASSDIVRRAIAERRGAGRGSTDFAGPGEYAFAFTPMQLPTSLTVLVALPLAGAMREAEAVFWRNVGWTTLIFLLAAIVAIAGSQLTVVRPIRELQNFADALSRGDFQSRPPADRGGAEELRQLGMHFDTMRGSLEQRQAQLVEALQQKEMLLKEVNHRVKNSLQLVASLIGLQRASIKDPEARRQFEEAGRRINTVAQIHQRLYQDEHVDRVALDRFLKELCADLQSVMDRGGQLSIVCETTPCHLPTEQVIPAALIANELATNAVKYGYPGDTGGVIHVTCEQGTDCVTLTVSDDGKPLPENFEPSKNAGLGMKMIMALAKQLRATLDVVRRPDGKSFILRIPVLEDRHAS